MKNMDAKTISFTLMMGVLGNVLFAVSYYAGNLAPGVALDFSLIAACIAGFYGGPLTGFISGLFVGIMPGIMFGPLGMGSWLGLFGLPLGKGLTGLTAGIVSKSLGLGRKQYSSLLAIPATLLAYVPECLFTYAYFAYLMPFFLEGGGAFTFIVYILPKALAEVTIISFLMAAIIGNHGFNDFIGRFFTKPHIIPRLKASESD
jgi:hypothetical protein